MANVNDFNPNFLNRIRGVVDRVRTSVQVSGVNIAASHEVVLVKEIRIGANEAAGKKGERHHEKTQLTPNPRVHNTGRWRTENGVRIVEGDAVIEQISQGKHTREQLTSAHFWLVDGEAFKLLNGLVDDPDENGIYWRAVLRRCQQGEYTPIDKTRG